MSGHHPLTPGHWSPFSLWDSDASKCRASQWDGWTIRIRVVGPPYKWPNSTAYKRGVTNHLLTGMILQVPFLPCHNHGSGQLPEMKGNYYWREAFFTSMIMGGRVRTHMFFLIFFGTSHVIFWYFLQNEVHAVQNLYIFFGDKKQIWASWVWDFTRFFLFGFENLVYFLWCFLDLGDDIKWYTGHLFECLVGKIYDICAQRFWHVASIVDQL